MLRALIFDVDGTLADTESAHRAAFNYAFSEFGLDWHWDDAQYTALLEISGGKERILHYWRMRQPELRELGAAALQDAVNRLHDLKTAAYGAAWVGQVQAMRWFRDAYLKSSPIGRDVVRFYYTYSPPLARVVHHQPVLRGMARVVLQPFADLARKATAGLPRG